MRDSVGLLCVDGMTLCVSAGLVVLAILTVVVVTVADLFVNLVQDETKYLRPKAIQCAEHSSDGLAIRLTGSRNYQDTIDRRCHLKWFSKT
jgi:hypothetical protein